MPQRLPGCGILGDAAPDWLRALEVIEQLCGAHVVVGMTTNQPECVVRLSSSRKIGINGCSIRHLTLTESPAIHTVGRMYELELASHMRAAWLREIRDDTSCVVRDEVRRRVYPPVTPATAAS